MRREAIQGVSVPAARPFDASQRVELVFLVGDPEPRLQQNMRAELTKQLGAEGVDGAALDLRGGIAEPDLEAVRDLSGGLVGECEGADARRVESELLDEKVDPLGEAEGFARAGSGEDE